ncbi:hypothetical protein L596_026851 [Steinernema carpocapsae]|uniref:Uncharacterized protein n=1 Tax=Steinernema carpocapsae TaxID=34508 RepID=A0A4U5M2M8_STECR|nr:hypothetical protein L596_026851 [Steinernema carpocapsae]
MSVTTSNVVSFANDRQTHIFVDLSSILYGGRAWNSSCHFANLLIYLEPRNTDFGNISPFVCCLFENMIKKEVVMERRQTVNTMRTKLQSVV